MAAIAKDRTDLAVPLMRRNFVLNAINGALSMVAARAIDQETVVSLLVLGLSGADWAVGLAVSVQHVGRVATQVFAARALDHTENKRPVYRFYSVARVFALLLISGALLLGKGQDPSLILAAVLVGLFVFMLGNGISELAWIDITARSVPSDRRGGLMTWRRLVGLILAVALAAPVVDYYLRPGSGYGFPANYGMLFLFSTLAWGLAWTVFSFVKEPPPHAATRRLTLRQHFARGLRIVRRDGNYRRLLWQRLLSGLACAAPPFFIIFGSRVLGLEARWAALFITVRTVSEIVASVVFGRISDRLGNRAVIVVANWCTLATFVVAALAAFAALSGPAGTGGWQSLPVALLGLAFVGLGCMAPGREMGEFNYMLDIAPAAKRPSYIGFGNAFLLPLGLAPIAVGALVPAVGYMPVFAGAAVCALLAIVSTIRLQEPRARQIAEARSACGHH